MKRFIVLAVAVGLALISVEAQAALVLDLGLQADTFGWVKASQPRGNYGALTWFSNDVINLSYSKVSYCDSENTGDLTKGFDFWFRPFGIDDTTHKGLIIYAPITSTGLLIGSLVDLNLHDCDDPRGNHYGSFMSVEVPHRLMMDGAPQNAFPGSLLLLGSGLVGLGLYRRRRSESGG